MKQFNKKILAASILLALGSASNAWANPTNTATEVVESQTASVDSTAKGQGNSSISEGGTSTIGAISDTNTKTDTNNSQDNDVKASYNQDNDTKTLTKTDTNNSQDNDVKASYNQDNDTKTITKTDTNNSQDNDVKASYNQDNDTKTITKNDSEGKAEDQAAAVGRDGTATSTNTKTDTKNITKNDSEAKAKDQAAAVGRDGTATSNNTNNKSDAKGDGSAASNVGNATATNNKSDAEHGSASSNTGTATSTYVDLKLRGDGNAVAGIGNATSTYKVNNQYLDGTVTGLAATLPDGLALLAGIPVGNSIDRSVIGNAGITQTFQNSGNGLAQQSVLVDGTVTVGNGGTSTLAP